MLDTINMVVSMLPSSSATGSQAPAARRPPPQERRTTFNCPVCRVDCAVADRFVFAACGEPRHGTCRGCARRYLEGQIEALRIDDLVCIVGAAAPQGCSSHGHAAKASEEELQELLAESSNGEALLRKYSKQKMKLANPRLRECPSCYELVAPRAPPDCLEKDIPASMQCPACDAQFCYYHSWAHKGERSCKAYEARLAREAKKLAVVCKKIGTQPCPGCGWQTEKNGGCNHMTCRHCKCDWCWTCGKKIDSNSRSISLHYADCRRSEGEHHPEARLAWRILETLVLPVKAASTLVVGLAFVAVLVVGLPYFLFCLLIGLCLSSLCCFDSIEPILLMTACAVAPLSMLMITLSVVGCIAVGLVWLPLALLCFVGTLPRRHSLPPGEVLRCLLSAPFSILSLPFDCTFALRPLRLGRFCG